MWSATNKLKKSPPSSRFLTGGKVTMNASATSRTLQYATSYTASESTTLSTATTRPPSMQPLTATEQYWAARALQAETLLAAQEVHQRDIRFLGHEQEMKRQTDLTALAKEHHAKHATLERLLMFLFGLVALLVILVIYLATHYTRHSTLLHNHHHANWWSALGASHFTIPILSPFTSVVEHETSVIGAKTIGTISAIAACLAYFVFRHWFSHKTTGKPSSGPLDGSTAPTTTIALSRAIDQ